MGTSTSVVHYIIWLLLQASFSAMAYGHSSTPTVVGSPLYFFYDCEATGLDVDNDRIIEVAAVVYTKNLPLSSTEIQELTKDGSGQFSSLCHCTRELHPEAAAKVGITLADLRHEPPLHTVLDQFFDWIENRVNEAEKLCRSRFTPVLTGHGGLDFPLLLAELQRINSTLLSEKFDALNVHFADTHSFCKKLSKSDDTLARMRGLGMEAIYKAFFPLEFYDMHRALPDAKALCKLFTDSPLSLRISELSSMIEDKDTMLKQLKLVKAGFSGTKARDLLRRGITIEQMEREYQRSPSGFHRYLRTLGINNPRPQLMLYFRTQ